MAQKSAFKMQQQGVYVPRKSFPQLPGAIVENPTYIETKHGNKLLTSGWWAYARKPVRDVHAEIRWQRIPNTPRLAVELHRRLDAIPYVGALRRSQHPDHALLPSLLPRCLDSPM